MNTSLRSVLFGILIFAGQVSDAAVRLPRIFSDGMVLQRGMPVPVWGWSDRDETVTVSFNGSRQQVSAKKGERWKISLPVQQPGGPFVLEVRASDTLTLKDVWVGDVWLCSGQSNMEYELFKSAELYPKEIAAAANPRIRHFKVTRRTYFNRNEEVMSEQGWEVADPRTVLQFTAVGWFFARELESRQGVPIGLINCSYGGTPAEGWMHEDELKDFPAYRERALPFRDTGLVAEIIRRDKALSDGWLKHIQALDDAQARGWQQPSADVSGWTDLQVPGYWADQGMADSGGAVVWYRRELDLPASMAGQPAVLRMGAIVSRDITWVNGKRVGGATNRYVNRRYDIPAGVLKAGRNTIVIKILNESGKGGFIPGKPYRMDLGADTISLDGGWKARLSVTTAPLLREQTTRFQDQAGALYHGMLEPLIGYGMKGVIWYQGESNISRAQEYRVVFSRMIQSWRKVWGQGDFPFLYAQLANNNPSKAQPSESRLAELQEAQARTLSVPNTGMAVLNDIGESNDVHPLNKLDVGLRLSLVARYQVYGERNLVYSGPVLKDVQVKGDRMILSFDHVGGGLISRDGGPLKHFALSGDGKRFVWAQAVIEGDRVVVSHPYIRSPKAVRYAWADTPEGANLGNREGLPAGCFRWPVPEGR
jgi:sialate O-acetylesterase